MREMDTHHFVCYEGKEGQTIGNCLLLCPGYIDVLIPVLHHVVVAGGVHNSDLRCYHLQGSCKVVQGAHMPILGM